MGERACRARPGAWLCALGLLGALLAAAPALAGEQGSVGLGSGGEGSYEWSARAVRPASGGSLRAGSKLPCLVVETKWRTGRFDMHRNHSRECVVEGERLSATSAPLIATGNRPGGPGAGMSAVAMIFAPPVSVAVVEFCDGARRTVHLQSIGAAEASSAGLGRFRYAAFSQEGTWCAARIVGRDASGRTLWDSASEGI